MAVLNKLLLSIGAMKSGTSFLADMLRRNDAVQLTPVKEVHYFYGRCQCGEFFLSPEERLNSLTYNLKTAINAAGSKSEIDAILDWSKRYLDNQIDDVWFANLFSDRSSNRYCSDFSNLNFILPAEGWSHVRRIAETLKIIVLLRDPIERLWSHVKFHASFTGDLSRINAMNHDAFAAFINTHYLHKHGAYAEVIAELMQQFSGDEVGIFFFEDMVENPMVFLRRIENFLGIAPQILEKNMNFSATNIGPRLQMPDAFMQAAEEFVGGETAKVRDLGLEPPASWAASS